MTNNELVDQDLNNKQIAVEISMNGYKKTS